MSSPTEVPTREEFRRHQHRQTAAFVFFVLWTAFLFWQQSETEQDRRDGDAALLAEVQAEAEARADEIEQESRARAFTLCQRSNEARQGIRDFLTDIVRGDDGVISEREQAALDIAAERFAPQECPPEPSSPEG